MATSIQTAHHAGPLSTSASAAACSYPSLQEFEQAFPSSSSSSSSRTHFAAEMERERDRQRQLERELVDLIEANRLILDEQRRHASILLPSSSATTSSSIPPPYISATTTTPLSPPQAAPISIPKEVQRLLTQARQILARYNIPIDPTLLFSPSNINTVAATSTIDSKLKTLDVALTQLQKGLVMLEKVCNKENKARVRVLLAGIKQIRAGVGAFRVSFCEGDVGGIGTSSATGIAPVLSTPSVSPPSQYQQQQPQQQPKNSIYALTATAKSVAILARSASTTTTAVAARAIDEINGILQRKPKTSSVVSFHSLVTSFIDRKTALKNAIS